MEEKKPFVSVIIPIYNGRKYLKECLDSVVAQGMGDDLEVVLIDDNSEQTYDDILALFAGMNINMIKNTSGTKGPGPARQCGIDVAKGEWIVFLDVDDSFCPNIMPYIKNTIIEQDIQTVVRPLMRCVFGDQVNISSFDWTWILGKWYKKSFLDAAAVKFRPELFTHEDVNFNQQVTRYLIYNELEALDLQVVFYNYVFNEGSITRTNYENNGHETTYTMYYMDDYLGSIFDSLIEYLREKDYTDKEEPKAIFTEMLANNFIYAYFYEQVHRFRLGVKGRDYTYYKKYLDMVLEFIPDYEEYIGFRPMLYIATKNGIMEHEGPFIEKEGFYDFIKNVKNA